jgi:hypothetical protein
LTRKTFHIQHAEAQDNHHILKVPAKFTLHTSFKPVSSDNQDSVTFEEAGLCPSAMILVREVEEEDEGGVAGM